METNDKMIVSQMVEAGVIDESETDFDESENEEPKIEEPEEYTIPHEMKLETPIRIGSREITSVTFKKPLTAGMLKHFPMGEGAQIKRGHYHPVLEKMTGETSAVINDLSNIDWFRAIGIVSYFLA